MRAARCRLPQLPGDACMMHSSSALLTSSLTHVKVVLCSQPDKERWIAEKREEGQGAVAAGAVAVRR